MNAQASSMGVVWSATGRAMCHASISSACRRRIASHTIRERVERRQTQAWNTVPSVTGQSSPNRDLGAAIPEEAAEETRYPYRHCHHRRHYRRRRRRRAAVSFYFLLAPVAGARVIATAVAEGEEQG